MPRVVKQVLGVVLGLMLCCAAPPAMAAFDSGTYAEPQGGAANITPQVYKDVGIDEHRGAQVPLDLPFTNEMGKNVTLKDLLVPGKPLVLQLGYFGCPNLCDLVSKGMVDSLGKLPLVAGKDFSIVFISFDPKETWQDGQLKKSGFMKQYDRPVEPAGWHFLVGSPESVRAVTDAVGFKYKWVESAKQFSHPAAIILLTPEGKVSQYLYGVSFPEQNMRLGLVQASNEQIGSATDRILLYCFHYDVTTGKYTLASIRLMRLAGALTVLILGVLLVPRFVRDARAARAARAGSAAARPTAGVGAADDQEATTTKENSDGR